MIAVNRKTGRCRKLCRKECVCWKSRYHSGCLDCPTCDNCEGALKECPNVEACLC